MKEERKLSTSDIAQAADRRDVQAAERDRIEHARQAEAAPRAIDEKPTPLFADDELTGYRARWSGIQTGFVDEPRKAVEEADTLVAELMARLADGFAEERRRLESQWEKTEKISTEDLRLAMRRYRSFFERLLSI
jgi:enoyl-CoA hydratase/carnithine racemase